MNDSREFSVIGKSAPNVDAVDKVTGRVTYSQEILKEFGWIEDGKGTGVERKGSGYSQI